MTEKVKCTVKPGRVHHGFDTDGKRVTFVAGETVVVSSVAAGRFTNTLAPQHKGAKADNKKVDVEKETMSAEQREKAEEAAAKINQDKAEADAEKAEKAKAVADEKKADDEAKAKKATDDKAEAKAAEAEKAKKAKDEKKSDAKKPATESGVK